MSVDHIRYDVLAQEALRGMVRHVLTDVAKNGLPGDHHFYVSFDTQAPGVRISPRLRAQYPEDMTIVLQHQFWDLVVTDEAFEVGASFGGVPERLLVPFAAIKRFSDPSVEFVLQFEIIQQAEGEIKDASPLTEAKDTKPDAALTLQPSTPAAAKSDTPAPKRSDGDEDPKTPAPTGGGEVVRLDRFRKK